MSQNIFTCKCFIRTDSYGQRPSNTIPKGTLIVDLMDPNQKQLIFRGIATDTLSDKPEQNAKKIDSAVRKIFEKYPPKS
jgi:Domain of unknown function (DUF4136)